MDTLEKQVRLYQLPDGQVPYLKWILHLKDQRAKQKIQVQIARLRLGNFGHSRSVGDGVKELKIEFGPGYRVYFGHQGGEVIILLCGGNKSTQNEDIQKAKKYWTSYKKERIYADH